MTGAPLRVVREGDTQPPLERREVLGDLLVAARRATVLYSPGTSANRMMNTVVKFAERHLEGA